MPPKCAIFAEKAVPLRRKGANDRTRHFDKQVNSQKEMKAFKDYTFEDFRYRVQSSEREFDFSRREFVSFYAVKPEH